MPCFDVDLKTGCFLIGYINLVATFFVAIDDISYIIWMPLKHKSKELISPDGWKDILSSHICNSYLTFLVLDLVFTVILIVGLHKNKLRPLLAYMIYSVVFVIITIANYIATNNIEITNYVRTSSMMIVLAIGCLLVINRRYYLLKKSYEDTVACPML